jgi:hypothetical protein
MKTIKFSEEEISLLRNMYEDELAQAKNYVEQIKDTLKKLGAPAKASNEISIEKEPKVKKRRGRKPKAKGIEPKVAKKRGRKPKAVPTPAMELPKKRRGRKPKIVVSTTEKTESAVSAPIAKKGIKKATPKTKKKIAPKPKVSKKVVIKKAPKVAPSTEAVPTQEVKQAPKKEIKKVVKRKTGKRRAWKGNVRLAPLSKPLTKKEPVVEPVAENPPAVEPIIPPTEEPKE